MTDHNQYELHAAGLGSNDVDDPAPFPWQRDQPDAVEPPFAIRGTDGTVWARLNRASGRLERAEGLPGAEFAFRVLQRRFSTDLALLTRRGDVLVNGLPALKLTLLGTKDSVRLAAGRMFYVTERVRPYVGPATEEHVGKKCPFCRLTITADTFVATCRCGAVYQNETAENRPDLPDEDRLNCVAKVQTCLACGHELTLSEHLVWEPASL